MDIANIVDLTITVTSATLDRVNFSTPLALVSKVPAGWGTAKVRTFSKVSELKDLGFATTDAAYKLAQKIKSQSPCPKTFKMAKRGTAPSQSIELTVTDATEGAVYTIDVGVDGGARASLTYTVLAAATTSSVATAIELLIEAVTGVSSSAASAVITITPTTAGTLVALANWSSNFTVKDVTPDPGVADDLDDVLDEDTAWYGLLLDSNSEAEVAEAAAWVEANKRVFAYATSDSGCISSIVTTDVASDMKAAAYARTFGLFSKADTLDYRAAAWLAKGLSYDPGKATWAFKTLSSITRDKLTAGELATLDTKNLNYYVNTSGKNLTFKGRMASGEYVDVIVDLDWVEAEMKLQVFAAISGLPKTPYTNAGIALVEGTIKGVLKKAVRAGVFADDEFLTVTMPKLTDIDATTRANRQLPDVAWTARLAGAIHTTVINGTVSA